jgi:hypothetical protein
MTEPTLALQTALRAKLIGSAAVTDLVPAASIFDGTTRPELFPCVIIGDGQTVLAGDRYENWRNVWAYADLHILTEEVGLESAKTIAGAVWDTLGVKLDVPGFELWDGIHVTGARYMRDPSQKHGHGIVSVEALMGFPT